MLTTKVYRRKKLREGERGVICRLCHQKEETVPHLLCSCSAIAQSLYKARRDRMLRPVYHQMLSLYGFVTDQDSTPWYKQSLPNNSVDNEKAKILWDIPIQLDIAPQDSANKPDIMVVDKKKEQ